MGDVSVQVFKRPIQKQLVPSARGCDVWVEENFTEKKYGSDDTKSLKKPILAHWTELLQTAKMKVNRSTIFGLIAISVMLVVLPILLVLNIQSAPLNEEKDYCITLTDEETCFSLDGHPFRYYGTKTAYHIAASNKTVDFQMGNCKPQIFYMLSRHATRYPDKEDIEEMIKHLPLLQSHIVNSSLAGKGSICKADVNKLQSWKMTWVPSDDNRLSRSGEEETVTLAEHYKDRFPSILKKAFTPEDFVIQYTSRERTRSTAEAFALGLFGQTGVKSIDFEGKTNDDVLQFHKQCKSLQKKCGDSVNLDELKKFDEGPFMKYVINSISKRLGFAVTKDDVNLMSRACAFSYALQKDDIWCAVFSSNELKVLEYEGDLDDYYKDGYGNEINYEQACPVVNYVVELFKSSMNTSKEKAVLHFSHAGAVKKVYPRFGLFRDEKDLPADGVCSDEHRKWKSSLISPFNTNLVLILMKCDDEHKVVAFHNEQAIQLGGCSNIFCPVQDFYNHYNPISEKCDNKKLCCKCCKT